MKKKKCSWCGDEFQTIRNGQHAKFCSKTCSNDHWTEVKRQKRTGDYTLVVKYGSHGFDRWVNLIWNGSGVRGHATAA